MHPYTICSLIVAFRNRGRPRSVCVPGLYTSFLVRVHDWGHLQTHTNTHTHTHTHSCKGSQMRMSKVIFDPLEILLTTVDLHSRKITVNLGPHTHYTHLVLCNRGLPPTPQKTSHFNMHPYTIWNLHNSGLQNQKPWTSTVGVRPRFVYKFLGASPQLGAFTNAHTHTHTYIQYTNT